MDKQIIILLKQNDSIYNSLISKNISFDRLKITDDMTNENKLAILNDENIKLKEIIKANKPVEKPKEEKKKIEQPKKEIVKEDKEDEEDEVYEDKIKKFDTITNMEELKRAFFNDNYELFNEELRKYTFKYYRVEYKYNSDKDGTPEFSAKNLLRGFIRNFDDYRKYFMICFRCYKYEDNGNTRYEYKSLWIVNTNEDIQNIIGSIYDDFIFNEDNDLDQFILDIKKYDIENTNFIGESYVH